MASKQNKNSVRAAHFFPSLQDFNVKFPHGTCYGGSKRTTSNFSLLLNLVSERGGEGRGGTVYLKVKL